MQLAYCGSLGHLYEFTAASLAMAMASPAMERNATVAFIFTKCIGIEEEEEEV